MSKGFSKGFFLLNFVANICYFTFQYWNSNFPIFSCLNLPQTLVKMRHCNTWWYCPIYLVYGFLEQISLKKLKIKKGWILQKNILMNVFKPFEPLLKKVLEDSSLKKCLQFSVWAFSIIPVKTSNKILLSGNLKKIIKIKNKFSFKRNTV